MGSYVLIITFMILMATQYTLVECAKKMNIDELKDMLKPMSKSCKGKTGVSDELIAGTKKGEFPRERTLMCYFKCLSIMLKAMTKSGEINKAGLEKQIDLLIVEEIAPRMKEVGNECYKEVTPLTDACEYAYELVVCAYKKDPALYFLP